MDAAKSKVFGVAESKKIFTEAEVSDLRLKLARLASDLNLKKLTREDYAETAFELVLKIEKLTTLSESEIALKQTLI
jgi:hypothetical protein